MLPCAAHEVSRPFRSVRRTVTAKAAATPSRRLAELNTAGGAPPRHGHPGKTTPLCPKNRRGYSRWFLPPLGALARMSIPDPSALFVLALLAVIFAAFVSEKFPPDSIVLGGVAVLLATGILPTSEALAVFSNAAPITVAAMFILSGALMRTGAIEAFGEAISSVASRRPALALAALIMVVVVVSAFINNTPVVIVLIPVVIKLATRLGESPSRFLIPLSYAAILGGTCTLIGTSTNPAGGRRGARAGSGTLRHVRDHPARPGDGGRGHGIPDAHWPPPSARARHRDQPDGRQGPARASWRKW